MYNVTLIVKVHMVCRLQINKQNEKLGRLGRIAIADIMMLKEITTKMTVFMRTMVNVTTTNLKNTKETRQDLFVICIL